MKVLMVCLGNICRSPLAEGILKNKLKEKGLDWTVDSAGTGFWHIGEQPDPRSIAVARLNGIDITGQRARQFEAADLDRFDLVLAMDRQNFQDVQRLATTPEQTAKIEMILNLVQPGKNQSVPDPYWNDNGFEEVFHLLDRACDQLIENHSRVKTE